MSDDRVSAFKNELAEAGWTFDQTGWACSKGDWELVFDTGVWLMLFVGVHRSHDFAIPESSRYDRWAINHIEYLLALEQRVLE